MQSPTTDHRKRRRRRQLQANPQSVWLQKDDGLSGHTAVLSRDLYGRLFQYTILEDNLDHEAKKFIGITFSREMSHDLVSEASWGIFQVRPQTENEAHLRKSKEDTVSFAASSLVFRSFLARSRGQPEETRRKEGPIGYQVHVLDVEPLTLEAVYVDVDGDALKRHNEVQKQFGGGFTVTRSNSYTGKAMGASSVMSTSIQSDQDAKQGLRVNDQTLISAVRKALGATAMVHQQDAISLPLPTHPITHVAFPQAIIATCEPVDQGLVTSSTRIIVNRSKRIGKGKDSSNRPMSMAVLSSARIDKEEDSSNEPFYSAIENDAGTSKDLQGGLSLTNGESLEQKSDTSSDEIMDSLISLTAPSIISRASGAISSRATATPRANWSKHTGTGTPGSIFSNHTSTTMRKLSADRSKIFRAKSLLHKIPDSVLHPRPAQCEDDEAQIFVDTKHLLKLGCFSGDWVTVQPILGMDNVTSIPWNLGDFTGKDHHSALRPAKIYGLPNLQTYSTHQLAKRRRQQRLQSNGSLISDVSAPSVWLSPLMLFNLGQPKSVRIVSLSSHSPRSSSGNPSIQRPGIEEPVSPPLAKEVTLLRVSSPLSTERRVQNAMFSALKAHFEMKNRILAKGDLLALPIDTSAGKLLSSNNSNADSEMELDQALEALGEDDSASRDVVWFKVGDVLLDESAIEANINAVSFGRAVCVESRRTRMRQVGSTQCALPRSMDNPWQYFYGISSAKSSSGARNFCQKFISSAPRPFVLPLQRRLRELMTAACSLEAQQLSLDPIAICLHSTQRGTGKYTIAKNAASDIGLHVFEIDAFDIVTESPAGGDMKSEALLKARLDRALMSGAEHTVVVLRHLEVLTADRMVMAFKDILKKVRIFITTTSDLEKVADGVRGALTHEFEIAAPDEGQREGILRNVIESRGIEIADSVDLPSAAVKTAALVAENLVDIVDRASIARQDRLATLITKAAFDRGENFQIRDILLSGGTWSRCIVREDFDSAIGTARQSFAGAIGAPKIPNVTWDDVGGLEHVKDAVVETIQLPLERPELFAKGMKKRSGILFYGPPGTGKTLLAKAIATEFSLNFFSVKGPELLNMYIGESEANVRRVFQKARDARPCVVFFDELDSVAPKRGNQGDSGGVMDRIVSQLLAELDGMSNGAESSAGGVFVIGATNRPDLLDQALLRPGRFDKMLYLGVSDTHEKQLTILEALTRKFSLDKGTSLRRVAGSLPFTYTGADMYALCSDAMLKAITRKTAAVEKKIRGLPGGSVSTAFFFDHLAKEEDITVTVTEHDFLAARDDLVGSVS